MYSLSLQYRIPPFFGSIQPFTGGIWKKRGGFLQLQEICDQKRGKKTYQEIADEADVPIRTVGGCLSGTTKAPSVYTVGAICRVLHVSLDDYFGIEPDEPQEHRNELELTQLQLEHERQDNDRKDRIIGILGALALLFGGRCVVMDINSHAVGFYRGTWDAPAIVSMAVTATVAAGIAGLIIYNFRRFRRKKK